VTLQVFHKTKIPINKSLSNIILLVTFIGVLGLGIWVFTCVNNPKDAFFSYLIAYMATLTISLGCLIFVLIQYAVRAGWSVVVRRIAEVISATIPLFLILFIPILIGAKYLFPWMDIDHIDPVLQSKLPYLNTTFFTIRSFGYLIIWSMMGLWFYIKSIKSDKILKESDIRINLMLSAPCIFIFALSISFASFDWIMSLQPHWYSTIFGVYIFSGSILSALCLITIILIVLQKYNFATKIITLEHYHDLGKLIFGFTVFWAYIAFSQFIIMWYAAIPEEMEFYYHRLQHGWEYLSWIMPISHFFLPFFVLLSRHMKRHKVVLFCSCIWIIIMHFIDIYWLILPAGSALTFTISLLVSTVGISCIWIGLIIWILLKGHIIPIKDPRLIESINFENF